MIEIKPSELQNHIGKKIIIRCDGKEEEVTLVNIRPDAFSVKIKRDSMWDGIEPWYKLPKDNEASFNIYIHE